MLACRWRHIKKNLNFCFSANLEPVDGAVPSNSPIDVLKSWWSFTRSSLTSWVHILNSSHGGCFMLENCYFFQLLFNTRCLFTLLLHFTKLLFFTISNLSGKLWKLCLWKLCFWPASPTSGGTGARWYVSTWPVFILHRESLKLDLIHITLGVCRKYLVENYMHICISLFLVCKNPVTGLSEPQVWMAPASPGLLLQLSVVSIKTKASFHFPSGPIGGSTAYNVVNLYCTYKSGCLQMWADE